MMGGPGSGRTTDPARRRKAERLRARGLTFKQIARRLGVTAQGVRYMLGLTPPRPRAIRPDLRCATCRRVIPGSGTTGRTAGAVYCTTCLATMPDATFAQRVRSLRVARGLSRPALARLAGLDPSHLSLYERGRVQPRPVTVARLVRVLGPGLYVQGTPRR
jgi:transcriptional regulator with XRE-family HTH domain